MSIRMSIDDDDRHTQHQLNTTTSANGDIAGGQLFNYGRFVEAVKRSVLVPSHHATTS